MIKIEDKTLCCGCSACVQACPKQCIRFSEDECGFFYPKVDEDLCIECGLCEKVCPELNGSEAQTPLKILAATNPDTVIRLESSSGGAFSAISRLTLKDQGVVFGSIFNDNWEVIHSEASSEEGLKAMRGSKYSQSSVGDSFLRVKQRLKEGKKVLFSGTGCQIAGLKHFLGKECEELLTVEVACHGVPSPLVWKKYLDEVSDGKTVTKVDFRNKEKGWKGYHVRIEGNDGPLVEEPFHQNLYMKLFLKDLILRPSCYNCRFKSGKSESDLILADFWGADKLYPELDDDKGLSLILVNTQKGLDAVQKAGLESHETTYSEATWKNSALLKSPAKPQLTQEFWDIFKKKGFHEASKLLKHFEPSTLQKLRDFCVRIKKSLLD